MRERQHSGDEGQPVFLSPSLHRKLTRLALEHEQTVGELLERAIDLHYGEGAANARLRVVARLASLEASLGEPTALSVDLLDAVREYRSLGSGGHPSANPRGASD